MGDFSGQIPARLLHAVRNGRCVLFVGAGLSRAVKRTSGKYLPGWEQLIGELLTMAKEDGLRAVQEPQINQLTTERELLAAAQVLRQNVPADKLASYFLEIFGDPALRPTETHRRIPPIPFRAVLTSNYDRLVEDTYNEMGWDVLVFTYRQFHEIPSPLRNPKFFICKIHGDYKDYDSIILTDRDYSRLAFQQPGYRKLLEQIFAFYAVLFIGFSATDPDINLVIDELTAAHPGKYEHYIVLQRGERPAALLQYWQVERGLYTVEYEQDEGHTQLLAFLSDLNRLPVPTDTPPSTPISVLLTAHNKDLDHVLAIWRSLRDAGYRCSWVDVDPKSDRLWFEGLKDRLRANDFVVHLVSENNRNEMDLAASTAIGMTIDMVLILIGPIEPPRILRDTPSYSVPVAPAGPTTYNFLLDVLRSMQRAMDKEATYERFENGA